MHRQKAKKSESNRSATIILMIIAVVAFFGAAIWGITYLMNKNKGEEISQVIEDSSTLNNVALPPDTLQNTTTQQSTTETSLLNESVAYDYKMIFDITKSKERVFARSARLKKDGVAFKIDTLRINDTLNYQMYILRKLMTSDTLAVRDSLRKFFLKPIIIERKQ